jgi:hypothetical protein
LNSDFDNGIDPFTLIISLWMIYDNEIQFNIKKDHENESELGYESYIMIRNDLHRNIEYDIYLFDIEYHHLLY